MSATGNGQTSVPFNGWGAVQLLPSTPTWVGTVTFEISLDQVNWLPLGLIPVANYLGPVALTATAPGIFWTPQTGAPPTGYYRLRVSAFSSGTISAIFLDAFPQR